MKHFMGPNTTFVHVPQLWSVEIHKNELIQLQYDIISNEIFSYKYHFKPY